VSPVMRPTFCLISPVTWLVTPLICCLFIDGLLGMWMLRMWGQGGRGSR
jgi:hypothetical protein